MPRLHTEHRMPTIHEESAQAAATPAHGESAQAAVTTAFVPKKGSSIEKLINQNAMEKQHQLQQAITTAATTTTAIAINK